MSRILLIDDDEDYSSVMQTRFQNEGYQIEWFADPDEAIKKLDKDFKFDLIILDIEMPGRNGLSTLAYLKGHFNARREKGFDIPVVIATGLQSSKLRDIFESQKVADYVQKPFNSAVLIEKIEKILAKKGQL